MASELATESGDRTESGSGRTDDRMKSEVRELLGRFFPGNLPAERRNDRRHGFPFLVRLTPVAEDSLEPIADAIVVVGKDLSFRGLGFFHQLPLPYRRAVVTLEDSPDHAVSFLVDLSWCRFTRQGWYDSGGRFLQVVASSGY